MSELLDCRYAERRIGWILLLANQVDQVLPYGGRLLRQHLWDLFEEYLTENRDDLAKLVRTPELHPLLVDGKTARHLLKLAHRRCEQERRDSPKSGTWVPVSRVPTALRYP